MNWKLFARSAGTPSKSVSRRARFRPSLDRLEERTLLATTIFYLDDTSSSLTLSGTVAGAPVEEQASGSLTTSYTGYFETDYDLAAGLTFSPNTLLYANNSGDWEPAVGGFSGVAPANYGGVINLGGPVRAAIRDLLLSVFTDALPLTDVGDGCYSFSWGANQGIATYDGYIDYITPIPGLAGRESLAGLGSYNEAGDGLVCDFGGLLFLYAPVSAPVDLDLDTSAGMIPVRLRFDGYLIAYGFTEGGPDSGGSGLDGAAGVALVDTVAAPVFAPLPGGTVLTPAPVAVSTADLTPVAAAPVAAASAVERVDGASPALDRLALDVLWADGFAF